MMAFRIPQLVARGLALAWQARGSREALRLRQRRALTKILEGAWDGSPFYRRHYRAHGIDREDLARIEIRDLPETDKALLQENFDEVVTDRRLRLEKLIAWSEGEGRDLRRRYLNEYVVVRTSGTSGPYATFLYDDEGVQRLAANLLSRAILQGRFSWRRRRIAFLGVIDGRYAGVTMLSLAPGRYNRFRFLSLLDAERDTLAELEAFRPHVLMGYASAVHRLARRSAEGHLNIAPRIVHVGAEPLGIVQEEDIRSAWHADLYDLYSASESFRMAQRRSGEGSMTVFDDLVCLEILDQDGHEVPVGSVGDVVVTNLYGSTFPLIRYRLGDRACRAPLEGGCPLSRIKAIVGREIEYLPLRLDDGTADSLELDAIGLACPGLRRFQFLVRGGAIELLFEGDESLEISLRAKMERCLRRKGALRGSSLRLRGVDELPVDPETGKHRRLRILPA